MFEPKTFEVASSTSPFLAFTIEMMVSGIEVAAAVIVKAMIIGDTPNSVERSIEDLVKKKVKIPMIIKLKMNGKTSLDILLFVLLWLFFS